jgi:8-oxo-dGTP diphosphatase|tara:strand:- start:168 stop:593 length:426 start_codon:yes stop_codon:yes gene_type:complete
MGLAPNREYQKFTKYFTFSCVDLLIFVEKEILLTKRIINPFKGYWHLPGTIIARNENMKDAVKRAAIQELGKDIIIKKQLGTYESITPLRHDISHAFLVRFKKSDPVKLDFQSQEYRFFKKLPKKIPSHHKKMILDSWKLK